MLSAAKAGVDCWFVINPRFSKLVIWPVADWSEMSSRTQVKAMPARCEGRRAGFVGGVRCISVLVAASMTRWQVKSTKTLPAERDLQKNNEQARNSLGIHVASGIQRVFFVLLTPFFMVRFVFATHVFHRLPAVALLFFGFVAIQTGLAQGPVARLAEQEASRRQQRVITAADDIHRADVLLREGKVDDALALYEAVYNALPAAPLTEETRLVARAGYVQAGVQRAKQLMFEGRRDDANALLGKLLVASPGDQRVVETRKEFDDPDRYPPALTAAHVQRVGEVQKLLVLANSAFEIGDYDKATRAYQDVLRIDATNAAARRGMEAVERAKSQYYKAATDHQRAKMLSEVSRAWEDPVPPSAANLSAMFGAMTAAQTNEKSGRQEIVDKLRAYIMPKVDFAGATISEVVELLRIRSRDLDPTGKGVDFVVNVPEESAGKAISLSMENVPMDEVLRYVTELAGVSYRVEDFAVQITSIGERNSAIITRSFRVPPDFIQNSPAAAVPAGNDPFAAAPAPAGGGLTLRRMGAKEFLESRGVLFPD
ncbi:MAG: hypothetical protein JNG86_23475, partial [Verrucomicrobiaceae bacterium]|nr:hypothetical protein [Verrucomicrobiaceae bacterium]